jgi:hypothetical protein
MELFESGPLLDEVDLLVFVHIPKCGGTSVHRFMHRLMGSEYLNVHQKLVEHGLTGHIRSQSKITSIGGHFGIGENPAIALLPDRNLKYFSLVRDPVDRFISHYRYFTRSPKSLLLQQVPEVAHYSLREFVQFMRDKGTSQFNVQVYMLTGRRRFDETARISLQKNYVGVVPSEHSSVLFERLAGHFGQPEFENIRENISPEVDNLNLDDDSLRYIYSVSMEDLKLYNFVRVWFARSFLGRLGSGADQSAKRPHRQQP